MSFNNNKKEYWIKITMEDYGLILQAYFIAAMHLATQYPEPKRGRDSEWKKKLREKNYKKAEEFNESQNRFINTCRETMREVKTDKN